MDGFVCERIVSLKDMKTLSVYIETETKTDRNLSDSERFTQQYIDSFDRLNFVYFI